MNKTFGKDPLPQRSGGEVFLLWLCLKISWESKPFCLDSDWIPDDIHSPNEHYGLFNFYKNRNHTILLSVLRRNEK
jgi:hypothetical protein